VLAGPTKCGKTQFLLRVLRERRIEVTRHVARHLSVLMKSVCVCVCLASTPAHSVDLWRVAASI